MRISLINPLCLLFGAVLLASCSNMSPESKESLEDFRASLPGPLRGDSKPLDEYPTPDLSGKWKDINLPELSIRVDQGGDKLTVFREGSVNETLIKERLNATINGRSIKSAQYVNRDPKQIRPTTGDCSAKINKASDKLVFVCTYEGDSFSLNFTR